MRRYPKPTRWPFENITFAKISINSLLGCLSLVAIFSWGTLILLIYATLKNRHSSVSITPELLLNNVIVIGFLKWFFIIVGVLLAGQILPRLISYFNNWEPSHTSYSLTILFWVCLSFTWVLRYYFVCYLSGMECLCREDWINHGHYSETSLTDYLKHGFVFGKIDGTSKLREGICFDTLSKICWILTYIACGYTGATLLYKYKIFTDQSWVGLLSPFLGLVYVFILNVFSNWGVTGQVIIPTIALLSVLRFLCWLKKIILLFLFGKKGWRGGHKRV